MRMGGDGRRAAVCDALPGPFAMASRSLLWVTGKMGRRAPTMRRAALEMERHGLCTEMYMYS